MSKTAAEKIKEARMSAGLSQRQLSKELGISVYTLQNWEQGRRTPTPFVLNAVLDALGKYKKSKISR